VASIGKIAIKQTQLEVGLSPICSIFAPGGNLSVFLSNPEKPEETAAGRVAFGWWEESHYSL